GACTGSGTKPRRAGAGKRTSGETALIIADGVIDQIRRDGGDLLLTEGELHLYCEGLWSPADKAIEQRLQVQIQEGIDALRESDARIPAAAWRRLKAHPALYREHVDSDAAGKVCLTTACSTSSRAPSPRRRP